MSGQSKVMTPILASSLGIASQEILHAAVKRFQKERDCGKSTGNYGLTTSAGFRLAVATFDPVQVYNYLLNEMGIKVPVTLDQDGLKLEFGRFAHHSHATVIRDLQGAFRVMSLMHEDGRQVIKVMGISTARISRLSPRDQPSTSTRGPI